MSANALEATLPPAPAHRLGPQLGAGRVSTIHAFGRHEVLKLYPAAVPLADIEAERDLALAVQRAGLPVPAVQPRLVAAPDGRVGIVFARLDGPRLGELLLRRPLRLRFAARTLATVHRRVHATRGAGLPAHKPALAAKIERAALATDARRELLERLHALPAGDATCHGDLHLENIVLTATGPMVLDWTDATCGDPLADVARTWLMLRFATGRSPALRLYCRALGALYLRERLGADRDARAAFARWLPVVAAARLSEPLAAAAESAGLARFVQRALASKD